MIPKVILHRRPDNQLWEFWAFDNQGKKYEEEPIIEQDSGAIDAEIRRVVVPLVKALELSLKTMLRSYEGGLDSAGFGPEGAVAEARDALLAAEEATS